MITNEEKVSLANLRGGAAIEMFDAEFQRVLDNIVDPNTTDVKRKVILTVEVKPPPEKQGFGDVFISVKSSMAPDKSLATQVSFGRSVRGEGEAFELKPQTQMELPDNVRSIDDRKDGATDA